MHQKNLEIILRYSKTRLQNMGLCLARPENEDIRSIAVSSSAKCSQSHQRQLFCLGEI